MKYEKVNIMSGIQKVSIDLNLLKMQLNQDSTLSKTSQLKIKFEALKSPVSDQITIILPKTILSQPTLHGLTGFYWAQKLNLRPGHVISPVKCPASSKKLTLDKTGIPRESLWFTIKHEDVTINNYSPINPHDKRG